MREALIQRLRNLAGVIPHKHTLPSGADTVICSLEAFMQIKELAGEAADALERRITMPEYISREAALTVLDWDCASQDALDAVKAIPAADVVEVKKGEWIPVTNGRGGCECSQCHAYAPSCQSGVEYKSAYCPSCGAKMDGGQDDV